MYKIKILSIGKTKERWLIEALNDYTTRLKPVMAIEWVLAKDSAQLEAFLEKENLLIALNPTGKTVTSEQFSHLFHEKLLIGGSRLAFLIGGADGLTPFMRKKCHFFLSLSALTFTHQLTRLVLLEQIYRAVEIQKGSNYHK